jgi:hypothetical protein
MTQVFAVTKPILKLTHLIIAKASIIHSATVCPIERNDTKADQMLLVVAQPHRRPCHSYSYHQQAAGCPDKRLQRYAPISQPNISAVNKLILVRAYHELPTALGSSTLITTRTSRVLNFRVNSKVK